MLILAIFTGEYCRINDRSLSRDAPFMKKNSLLIKYFFSHIIKTHFTAGCFDFRKVRAFLQACVTIATCCGSLRLPDLSFDDVKEDEESFSNFSHNAGAITTDDDVEVIAIPRLNPSSSLITVIKTDSYHI